PPGRPRRDRGLASDDQARGRHAARRAGRPKTTGPPPPRRLKVELKILDPRLPGWGFPSWGSTLAAGLDLHACIQHPLDLKPKMPAVLISAGIAFRIGTPNWCALVVPRSGLGHREGLVLGNTIGVIDA